MESRPISQPKCKKPRKKWSLPRRECWAKLKANYMTDVKNGGDEDFEIGFEEEARKRAPQDSTDCLGSALPGPVAPAEQTRDELTEKKEKEEKEQSQENASILKQICRLIA